MNQPILIIMAAGIGSRYGGLKQMDSFGPGGERIIDYSVYDALRAGFGKIVFVINRKIEQDFRNLVGNIIDQQGDTTYVIQEVDLLPEGVHLPAGRVKPWGTGHATLLCKEFVDAPFAVINADDFYGASSFQILHDYLVNADDRDGIYDYGMVGYKLKNTTTEHGHVARGVCVIDKEAYLVEIHERTRIQRFDNLAKYSEDDGATWPELPVDSTVSMNMWGFTPSIFDELDTSFHRFFSEAKDLQKAEFFLPEVVNELLKAGQARVKVLPTQERWAGVTYQADKRMVRQYIAELIRMGLYPAKLWE